MKMIGSWWTSIMSTTGSEERITSRFSMITAAIVRCCMERKDRMLMLSQQVPTNVKLERKNLYGLRILLIFLVSQRQSFITSSLEVGVERD